MSTTRRIGWFLIVFLVGVGVSSARGVYQEPDAFLHETFAGETPQRKALWITPELKGSGDGDPRSSAQRDAYPLLG